MITAAVLALWITDNAQAVAYAYEVDRCSRLAGTKWACTAMPASKMPKPSQAWVDAIAAAIVTAPLLADARFEAIHMLVYAFGESTYRDNAVGDGGRSACSMGVMAENFGTTREALMTPATCIHFARVAMKRSFVCWPDHPMACYAGGHNAAAAKIADARAELVKQLAWTLPALKESGS